MAVYYSTTTMSKLFGYAINPMTGVLLSKLSNVSGSRKDAIINYVLRLYIPAILVLTIGNFFVSYLGVRFLYPQYLSMSIKLLLPISIASSVSTISFVIRPVIMQFFSSKSFLIANLGYAIVFIVSMFLLSNSWGIMGFAWATSLGRISQLIFYIFIVKSNQVREE